MSWQDRTTRDLKYQIGRLQWAADTTDDPLWRAQHLRDKATCQQIIAERESAADNGKS